MLRKTFIWAAKLIISCVILLILYQYIPFTKFSRLLGRVSREQLLAACFAFLLGQIILTFRLKVLTDKHRLSLGITKLLDINFTAQFYKLFIPGGTITSILVRSYKLKQASNKLDSVVSIILFDRLISTFGVFIGGAIFWSFHQEWLPKNIWGAFLAILIAMGGLYFCTAIITGIFQFFIHLSVGGTISTKIHLWTNALIKFKELSITDALIIFTLTLLSHLLGVLVFVLLASSLNIPLNFISMGWIRAAVMTSTMLPVTFAGLGVRDGSMVYLLGLYGVSGHEALAMSFLIFIVTVFIGAVIGGIWELLSMLKKDL
ncbi:MAG: UPF0104 family protein [Desulfobacteraceae bacterium]|nr:MAG: UPF0104 family protein [Desulfobacteraceae bacterium]